MPSIFLSRYLERIGSPRHDPTTGTLISAGEDLSRPGIIEWCFDVIYITCAYSILSLRVILSTRYCVGACQVGSGAFGTWVWWLYLIVRSRTSAFSFRRSLDPNRSPVTRAISCGVPLSLRSCWAALQPQRYQKFPKLTNRPAKGKRNYEKGRSGEIHAFKYDLDSKSWFG